MTNRWLLALIVLLAGTVVTAAPAPLPKQERRSSDEVLYDQSWRTLRERGIWVHKVEQSTENSLRNVWRIHLLIDRGLPRKPDLHLDIDEFKSYASLRGAALRDYLEVRKALDIALQQGFRGY